jgi:hypothetical protein
MLIPAEDNAVEPACDFLKRRHKDTKKTGEILRAFVRDSNLCEAVETYRVQAAPRNSSLAFVPINAQTEVCQHPGTFE